MVPIEGLYLFYSHNTIIQHIYTWYAVIMICAQLIMFSVISTILCTMVRFINAQISQTVYLSQLFTPEMQKIKRLENIKSNYTSLLYAFCLWMIIFVAYYGTRILHKHYKKSVIVYFNKLVYHFLKLNPYLNNFEK